MGFKCGCGHMLHVVNYLIVNVYGVSHITFWKGCGFRDRASVICHVFVFRDVLELQIL